jgi:hypothetical protein
VEAPARRGFMAANIPIEKAKKVRHTLVVIIGKKNLR